MPTYLNRIAIAVAVLSVVPIAAWSAAAQAAQGGAQQKAPSYTMPEYNQFTACQAEKDPTSKVKCLDGFVMQFPNSTLMQYVDQIYYQTYYQLKDYAKGIEYADKLVALGDKADLASRVSAIEFRVQVFPFAYNSKSPDYQDQLTKQRDAALQAVKLLQEYKAAPNSKLTDAQLKSYTAVDYAAAGNADLQLKNTPDAVQAFKSALQNNPNDALTEYHLGLAYLALTPPQSLDGFWALARAVDLKVQDADKVKDYLRRAVLAYEQPGCVPQVDPQLTSLLQMAANSTDRPATYTIPSADDLNKIRQSSNILTVIQQLSGGGDTANQTWLAICGAEFPEVVGKIVDVNKSDGYVDFMVFTGATTQEMQAATMANMDVKVWTETPPAGAAPAAPAAGAAGAAGANGAAAAPPQITPQPDVLRLQKEDGIRFSGTLVSFDPSPFLLHWDDVKVDPSIIPEKGAAPGKRPPHHVPAK
jgi:tetratricopeptide (TPR) repeat protein